MPSNMPSNHQNKLRRLRILQRLQTVTPKPMGELALLNWLRFDQDLAPTLELVRQSLDYLAEHGLVELIGVDGADWVAAILTVHGDGWLNNPEDLGLEIYNPGELPEPADDNYNGRVSSIEKLPPEVRAWLDQELVRLGFSDYGELTRSLNEQGWTISRSALGRYGKKFKEQVKQQKERAEAIRNLAEVYQDDAPGIMTGAMGISLTAVMDAIQDGEYNPSKDTLAGLVATLPRIGKGFREAEQHKIEKEARRKTIEEAAQVVEETARAQGLDDKWAKGLREKFLKGM